MLIHLNDDWLFYKSYKSNRGEPVRLPHTNVETPYNYFDEQCYQLISKYEKKLYVPEMWRDKSVLINFTGIAHESEIYVNMTSVYVHKCGYTPFTLDISKNLEFGTDNTITVIVNAKENLNQPPFGNVIDYMTYGGMYGQVSVDVRNKTYIKDIFVSGKAKDTSGFSEINIEMEFAGHPITGQAAINVCIVSEKGGETIFEKKYPVKEDTFKIYEKVENADNWDIDNPVLHTLTADLEHENRVIDSHSVDFGFRNAIFTKDGFYLNGRKIKITGLNRHQSYAYSGYAMPKRVQQNDADILKYKLNVNAVRTSHYPQSKHFIERCDRIGLLVFTEIPGWQHIGDYDWKNIAIENVKQMVVSYRNHPSIILWGVRINESKDDDAFYKWANIQCKKYDPYRQTGGVRNIKKSSFLEDVYTYNDFTYRGKKHATAPKSRVTDITNPYLITEYNGHMFPTKMWDSEPHRVEHALYHATVLSDVMKKNEAAGCFGWCMNDYNTHKDFGSGDRICYHGVLDMYRNPKSAAYVYASQTDREPVMHVASTMSKGDYPMSMVKNVWVFTNCDYVKMSINGRLIGNFYPDKKRFAGLLHPPVRIDDFTGNLLVEMNGFHKRSSSAIKKMLKYIYEKGHERIPLIHMLRMGIVMMREKLTMSELTDIVTTHVAGWGDKVKKYTFEGIKDDSVVITSTIEPSDGIYIATDCDSYDLVEHETYDVASITISAVDQNGNILNYCNEPLHLYTEGAVKIIGPCTISLRGGYTGTYIRSDRTEGSGTLHIEGNGITKVLEFNVKCDMAENRNVHI